MRVYLICLLLLLVGCSAEEQITGRVLEEKVTLATTDGINIEGTFYPADSTDGIILLHMYTQDRSVWKPYIETFRQKDFNVLTIDLRGHGGSDLSYTSMSKEDFNAMTYDVKAALDFLMKRQIEEITVIGASLGANVALAIATKDLRIKDIVLISPGLDYKGITTGDTIRKYSRPLLIIVGGNDGTAWKSSNTLFDRSPSKIVLQPYDTALHGTDMIKELPEVSTRILEWLETN